MTVQKKTTAQFGKAGKQISAATFLKQNHGLADIVSGKASASVMQNPEILATLKQAVTALENVQNPKPAVAADEDFDIGIGER
jgi:hypothetical protein